jgi:thymidylate synthase ThyX
MEIRVIAYDQDPDILCAAVGRLSRDKGVASEVLTHYRQDPEKATGVLSRILGMGHLAVSEHAQFEIAFDRVPVTVEWYMIQFRLGSYLVKSRRYVDYRQAGYETPDLPEDLLPAYRQFADRMIEFYGRLVDEGKPICGRNFVEDARFVLPYRFRSSFFCSMNARELAYCLYQAIYGWGSKSPSVKKAGEILLGQLQEIAPELFNLNRLEKLIGNRESSLSDLIGQDLLPQRDSSALVELWSASENSDEEVAISAVFEETLAPRQEIRRWLQAEPERVQKVIDRVVQSSRPRALEQTFYQYRINRVTWSSLTHFARHRIFSPIFPGLEKGCDNQHYILPESIQSCGTLLEIYQQAWSEAQTFSRYLIDQGGVQPQALSAVGYADTHPITANDSEQGRSSNRRIEIVLYPKDLAQITGGLSSPN